MANCPKTGEECPTLTVIEDGIAEGRNLCSSNAARVALMQFSIAALESGECEGLKSYMDDDGDVFLGVECDNSLAESLLEVVAIASDRDIEGMNYTEEIISTSEQQ
jgi:hypothetical protein